MATIRRTLLIEAPVTAVYQLARSFEQLPAFVPGVRAATEATLEARVPAGARAIECTFALESSEEDAAFTLVSMGDYGAQRMRATFVAVLGDATWSTWTLDLDCPGPGDTARTLTVVSRAVSDALAAFREEAERRARAVTQPSNANCA